MRARVPVVVIIVSNKKFVEKRMCLGKNHAHGNWCCESGFVISDI